MTPKPPIDPTFKPHYPEEINLRQAFRRSLLAAGVFFFAFVILLLVLFVPILKTRQDYIEKLTLAFCGIVLIFPLMVYTFFQRYLMRAALIRWGERQRNKPR